MLEQWGFEILFAIGRMFYNPLLYWAFLLLFIAGFKRVNRERNQFGVKILNQFSEIKQTFFLALIFGLFISAISILVGFVFTYDFLLVIAIVTFLLSISGSFHLLSTAYTIGIPALIFMLIPLLSENLVPQIYKINELSETQFVVLGFLVSIFFIVEALLINRAKREHIHPSIRLSDRGVWLGEQQLKRMAVIPFIVFVPTDEITTVIPLLSYFQLGNETFQLTILPLIVGVQFTSWTEYMVTFKKRMMQQKMILASIVLLLSIAGYFYFIFAIIGIVIAIIGNEWITYRNRLRNKYKKPVFAPLDEGIKVLATIPGSRAEELEIIPGETINRVNGILVTNSNEFYNALQKSGAFFKLEIIDMNNEVRFLQSAFYANDHHELGLLFPEAPYDQRRMQHNEKLSI